MAKKPDPVKLVLQYIDGAYDLCEIQESQIKRLSIAVWVLVAFNVVVAVSLMLLVYGNPGLVKGLTQDRPMAVDIQKAYQSGGIK